MTPDELRQIEERAERLDKTSKKLQFFDAMIGTNYPGDSANKAERDFFEWASINADTISDDIDHILAHVRELEAKYRGLEEAARNFFADYNDPESDPNYIGVLLIEMEHALAALEGKP